MAAETDDDRFAGYGTELADAVEKAIPDWIRRSVYCHLTETATMHDLDREALDRRLADIGRTAATDVGEQLQQLLKRDVDEQWTNPLSIIRTLVSYPTQILHDYGAAAPKRLVDQKRLFPDDTYDLTPANFAALGPEVHEAGIRWGAAKAHVHLQRHKKS